MDCCAQKQIGGLGLIDPKEALFTLLYEWFLNASELGKSNFKGLAKVQTGHMSVLLT